MHGLALCAGVGGLELGLRIALGDGYRTVCFVEQDSYVASVLVARMEDKAIHKAPIWDDIKTFDGKPWRGIVDIISTGFPCQPFSGNGYGKTTKDDRYLWDDVFRVICESQPSLVFIENVSAFEQLGWARTRSDLHSAGYTTIYGLFTAKEIGLLHTRERFFALAYANRYRHKNIPPNKGQVRGVHIIRPSDKKPHQDWNAFEPDVARMVDAPTLRVDKFRAISNSVVPCVAANAFTELARRAWGG